MFISVLSRVRNLIIFSILLILALIGLRCDSARNYFIIENPILRLKISDHKPVIYSIEYKPENIYFKGDSSSSGWFINGKLYSWGKWNIQLHKTSNGATYQMSLPNLHIQFNYNIDLDDEGLNVSVTHIIDLHSNLKTITWNNSPLLQLRDTSFRWWARKTRLVKPWIRAKPNGFYRGEWGNFECSGRIGDSIPIVKTIDACVWNNKDLALGIVSNIDLFPIRFYRDSLGNTCLGLNSFRHIIRGQVIKKNMNAKLIFLHDLNGDNIVNQNDYFLWRNRHLKEAPEFLMNALSYKVFMDIPPLKTPATTLEQLEKIVKSVFYITDGIPQIIYMVGWQFKGHDTGYPSLNKWNSRLGPHKMVYTLSKYLHDSLNTCLSYHINIDDAYKGNPGFSDDIMATDYDGEPMFWEMGVTDSCFHISHYKDVKTGSIFKRLNAFLNTVPVQKIVHIDAMRIINCNPAWEKDSIGLADELELGLKPIMQFLKKKGIYVTTEGQNSQPIEMTSLVSGFYHLQGPSDANLMIYHQKIIGGGQGEGTGRVECGLGTSIHADISYTGKNNTVSFIKDWKLIKERIYLGSFLYRYYLERILINVVSGSDSIFFQFEDGTETHINLKMNTLLIKRKDVTIALNDDRFIPFDNCIYAFSKNGSDREWTLPELFRGKSLNVFTLTKKGRGIAPAFKITGKEIRLKLLADVPVKIELK